MSTRATTSPLRRDPAHGVLAGVCAGLGRRLQVDPVLLRVGFVVASAAGGTGLLAYLVAWAVIPAAGEHDKPLAHAGARPGSWRIVAGIGLLILSALLLFRELGIWLGDAAVWPVALAATGVALIWRQSQRPGPHDEPPVPAAPPAALTKDGPGGRALRGPGFDLAAVPADRRGLRESIAGRMERHGGRAAIHTAPGAGTEIELTLERAP